MLCSNDSKTLRQSIESLAALSKFVDLEIIVTDNKSRDGSGEILRKLLKDGMIQQVIEQKCTRGKGRQLALEKARGDYVLCHLDCDDTFSAVGINSLIQLYHEKYDGMMMMTRRTEGGYSNITIAPRELILGLGGWRDINWNEDWDLWARAGASGKYVNIPYPYSDSPHTFVTVRQDRYDSIVKRMRARYGKYRDCYRIGRSPFAGDNHVSSSQALISWVAKVVVNLRREKLTAVSNPDFKDIN
ncbi:MAG: glycosyltransferase [Thaumarchaeota archaeon]|nr:glycosyltransferase [Nitrososphaerota archaeon]